MKRFPLPTIKSRLNTGELEKDAEKSCQEAGENPEEREE